MYTSRWMFQSLGAGEVCAKFKQEAKWRWAPEVDASPCQSHPVPRPLLWDPEGVPWCWLPRPSNTAAHSTARRSLMSCSQARALREWEALASPWPLAVCGSRKLIEDTVSKTDFVCLGVTARGKKVLNIYLHLLLSLIIVFCLFLKIQNLQETDERSSLLMF